MTTNIPHRLYFFVLMSLSVIIIAINGMLAVPSVMLNWISPIQSPDTSGSIVTHQTIFHDHRHQQAIINHAKKWVIATLFDCLKTQGFCLESTHLKDPQRLSQMIGLLTIALRWAFRTGEWLVQQHSIRIQKAWA